MRDNDKAQPTDGEAQAFLDAHRDADCFESSLSSPRAARRSLLALKLGPHLFEKGEYIVAELAANALVHAGGEFVLRVWWDERWARVEVHDRSSQMPVLLPPPRSTSGRGLQIVAALARNWGAYRTGRGKVVWAEIA